MLRLVCKWSGEKTWRACTVKFRWWTLKYSWWSGPWAKNRRNYAKKIVDNIAYALKKPLPRQIVVKIKSLLVFLFSNSSLNIFLSTFSWWIINSFHSCEVSGNLRVENTHAKKSSINANCNLRKIRWIPGFFAVVLTNQANQCHCFDLTCFRIN